MANAATLFSPLKNGFQFINRFELHLPIKYPIPRVGNIDLNDIVFGLCGGMCFSALDYFHAGLPQPEYRRVEDIDPATLVYLCDRQLDSLKIPVVMKVLEWMMLEDAALARKMSQAEIPKLRRMLDRGEPAVLALIRVRGLSDPTQNHQVIARGYEYDESTKKLILSLYDPNHPNCETSIECTLGKPSAGLSLVQSTGEPLRGFFIVPYSAQKNLPQPALAEARVAFAPEAVAALPFTLAWPVDSHRVNQYFGEHPSSYKPFGLPGHEGLDLFALTGANVYAAASGEVTQAGYPANHPYGRHIRVKHHAGGKNFETIYGHLSEIQVQVGQQVKVGERIGLADNTGNSFGSHLHLTLKIVGETTPGYPAGIVDPWPYLQEFTAPQPEVPLPEPSGITVYTMSELNLRSGPNIESSVKAVLPAGESVSVLGNADQVRSKVGKEGQWLQVLTAASQWGYVAAWLVKDSEQQLFPPSDLIVYPFDSVNLRAGPGTSFPTLATLAFSDPLTVLGDAGLARTKIGENGEWLQVQVQSGLRGFVAAWLVHLTGEKAPETSLKVFTTDFVNVRARPATDANILAVAEPGEPLVVLGDVSQAKSHIGQMDQWLNVQTQEKLAGYVAAWLVTTSPPAEQPSVETKELTVYATTDLNIRSQPSINSPRVSGLFKGEALQVIETDLQAAKDKMGKQDQWVYGRNAKGDQGWAAAWFLSLTPQV